MDLENIAVKCKLGDDMRLKYKDSEYIFSEFSYKKDNNYFCITPEDDTSIEICYYPVLQLDDEHDVNNFSYELFYNKNNYENNIFQVCIDSQRIGWIFPINALLSSEHDYANNIYFLKYAYVAIYLLLRDINSIDEKKLPQDFNFADHYDKENTIFVIDTENTKQVEDFNIEDYIVSLFKYGYTRNENGNFSPSPIKGIERLKIRPLSKELSGNPNINSLFINQFSLAKDNEIIKFHICYQIIELLISKVFEHKLKTIIKNLSSDSENLFDLREDLSTIAAEKERIKYLFETYTTCETSDKIQIEIACKQFLELNQKKCLGNHYYNLYSVRCMLVHKLYLLNDGSYEILRKINEHLLNITIDMLFSFHFPQ